MEEVSLPLNSTPFGMDWEPGIWSGPYQHALFLAFHGSFYSATPYEGTRIAFVEVNNATDVPIGPFQDFVTGFAGTGTLRRATAVVFAPDGRLFFADDTAGGVYWVAPNDLRSLP
jgi:glucose/arabinose dehydrogenase